MRYPPQAGYNSGSSPPSLAAPLLLVSDMDDTLIPGAHSTGARDEDTAALRDILHAGREAGRLPVAVAINTGRTLPLFEEAARHKAHCLPRADALIAGVGTRVYFAGQGGQADWVEDADWTAAMQRGWSHAAVKSVVDGAIDAFGAHSVYWQRPIEQHEHKATFLYRSNLREDLCSMLASGLEAAGVVATIIEGAAGGGVDWRFVDVLPRGAGKGAAMEHVRSRLGFGVHQTVACGDGSNDLLMLQQANLAVCVGNSQPEVVAWARQAQEAAQGKATEASTPEKGTAKHSKRVHLARPEAQAAAGILEGLHALGFIA